MIVLNGQFSSWADVNAGVHQGSILRPILFLMTINHLINDLSSNAKLFSDDTSLFSVVFNIDASAKELKVPQSSRFGITIDRDLKFDKHVLKLCSKAKQKLSALSRMAKLLSFNKRRTLLKLLWISI